MAVSKGKKFEEKFKEQFEEQAKNSTIVRLYDNVSSYKTIKNVGDFVLFKKPLMYIIDCKSTWSTSIPINELTQLEKMNEKLAQNPELVCGFVTWFNDKKVTYFVHCNYVNSILAEGKVKSIGYKALELASATNKYVVKLEATYPRLFGKYNFDKIFKDLEERYA